MDIQQAHNLFLRECTDGTLVRRRPGTIDNYKTSMHVLLKITGIKKTTQLNEAALRHFFRTGENKRKWTPHTTVSHRKNLSPFIVWAMNKKYIVGKNPLLNIPIPRIPKRLPNYYSEIELEAVMYQVDALAHTDFLRVRNNAVLAVLCLTGMRKGEALGLRIKDIDFEKGMIRVRAENAKDAEDRVIPISTQLEQTLRRYIDARMHIDAMTSALWVNECGQVFTTYGWKHVVARLSRKVGFNVSTHKFRHTFATRFYSDSGGDIAGLSRILGHSDIQTTMIYAGTMPEDLRAAVDFNSLNSLF